ncbi:MAG TPA: BON domain-containing protein, partial [Polyangiaceae bacterium]|nr:BON domain-containing protein [Polyangiaceae bacterium]
VAPRAAQPEEVPLTPSSAPGEPRPVAAPLVPVDPTLDKPESRDDEESIREIRAQLAADTSLSPTARRVSIVARKGRVRLSGQVNTAEERAAVERAARRAANVIDVRNELVVLQ